jgi:hypothetical protein
MSPKDELLFILDIVFEEERPLSDVEYSRAIDLIIGGEHPLDNNDSYDDLSTGGQND